MKKLIIIFSFISICNLAYSQNVGVVESAFKDGNAQLLSNDLANEIELCIGTEVEFYSSKEAVQALNKWFAKVDANHVSGKLVGSSAVKYYNGEVKTAKGNYRLFVYYNEKLGNFKIDEIRITAK